VSVLDDFAPDPNAAQDVLSPTTAADTSVLDSFAPSADTSVLDAPVESSSSPLDAFSPTNYDETQSADAPDINPDVIDEVSAKADEVGVLGRALRSTMTVIEPVVDILSRTNYATAGFAEALMDDDPRTNPFARAGREMFAGIGGLKGDKHDWGQALEQMGVGEGWKMSELMPWLYNEDGKGITQFEKGGIMDWTGRGMAGLGANILTDPLTYLDWSAKGVSLGLRTGGEVGRTGQVLKVGKSIIGKRILSKVGEEELVSQVGKSLGLSADGLEAFRRDLYTSLPNLDNQFRLRHADPYVQREWIAGMTELADKTKTARPSQSLMNLRNVPLADMPQSVLMRVTQAAQDVAEQKLTNIALSDPVAARKYFSDGSMRFMGKVIPGTPRASELLSQLSVDVRTKATDMFRKGADKNDFVKWMLESSRQVAGRIDGIGRLFKRDLSTNPIYNISKQKILDEMAMIRADLGSRLHREIGDIHMTPTEWEETIRALDVERRALGLRLAQQGVPNVHFFKWDEELTTNQISELTGRSIGSSGQIQKYFFDKVAARLKGKVANEEDASRLAKGIMGLLDDLD